MTRQLRTHQQALDDIVCAIATGASPVRDILAAVTSDISIDAAVSTPVALKEHHFTIQYGDTGHTYDSIFGAYLISAREVAIDDPYLRMPHQLVNFIRFCETVVKAPTIRRINLKTGYDDKTDLAMVNERLSELKQSLLEFDVVLEVELSQTMHDREIRIDNRWIVKIGRGLDFYQKPDGWYTIGSNDYSLRKCLETKVDIYPIQ